MVHCTTRPEPGGVWTLASAHALHPPCTLVQVFQVCSGDSEDSRSVRSGPGVRSDLELKQHPERGVWRSRMKLDLWNDKGFLEVWNRELHRGSRQGRVVNDRIKVNIQT